MTVPIRDGAAYALAGKSFNVYNRANYWGLAGVPSYGAGRLRGHALRAWERDRGRIDYTLYSYGTPIAWHVDGHWVIVDDSFSTSTNRHQSNARGVESWMGLKAEHVGVPRSVQWCTPAQRSMVLRILDAGHVIPRGQELRTIGSLARAGIVHGASYPLPGNAWVLKPDIAERITA